MSMDICITLSDADLALFANGMKEAQAKSADLDEGSVIDAARKLLEEGRGKDVPDFIAARLQGLESMITMVEDAGFGLPEPDRERVLAALTYFSAPDDIVPDDVPVLGLLDDAIMIELCMRDLKHEIEAYEDFREWRDAEAARRGISVAEAMLNRAEWAEAQRAEIIERMHRRREQSYLSGEWSSVLFRVH